MQKRAIAAALLAALALPAPAWGSYLGTPVPLTDAPWIAAMVPLDEHLKPAWGTPPLVFRCSGAVIGPRLILTASHCVDMIDVSHFGFRVGTDDLVAKGGTVVPIARVWTPQIGDRVLQVSQRDTALVETSAPLNVPALPLASARPQPGETVSSFGFGDTRAAGDERGTYRPVLQRLDQLVQPDCQDLFAWTQLQPICATAPNGGRIGHGDSGGPLVVWRDGAPALVGAASAAEGQDLDVFSDVTASAAFLGAPPRASQVPAMVRRVRIKGSARPGATLSCDAGFAPRPASVTVAWTLGGHGPTTTYYDEHGQRRQYVQDSHPDSRRHTFRLPPDAGGKPLQCVVTAHSGPWFGQQAVAMVRVRKAAHPAEGDM